MPIFFQKDIDTDTRLGIWKIEEEESFFLQKVAPQRSVTHQHKRLQHLAGRYLLQYLFPHFPTSLIQVADTRKPYLENEAYHFSISHCGAFAAVLVSTSKRVGVDIELSHPKIQKIKHKFLSEAEQVAVNSLSDSILNKGEAAHSQPAVSVDDHLILLWSCKEAVFKWFGLGEVDFKEHIQVQKIKQTEDGTYRTSVCFQKQRSLPLLLQSQFMSVDSDADRMVLSYVIT